MWKSLKIITIILIISGTSYMFLKNYIIPYKVKSETIKIIKSNSFEHVEISDISYHNNIILMENIYLDKDKQNKIKFIQIPYSPLDIFSDKAIKKITLKKIELSGNNQQIINIAKNTYNNLINNYKKIAQRIEIENIKASFNSPIGNIQIHGKIRINNKDNDEISITSLISSTTKQLKFDSETSINIDKNKNVKISSEIYNGKINTDIIKASRITGKYNSYNKKIKAEIHAGNFSFLNLPLNGTSLLISNNDEGYIVKGQTHATGIETIKLTSYTKISKDFLQISSNNRIKSDKLIELITFIESNIIGGKSRFIGKLANYPILSEPVTIDFSTKKDLSKKEQSPFLVELKYKGGQIKTKAYIKNDISPKISVKLFTTPAENIKPFLSKQLINNIDFTKGKIAGNANININISPAENPKNNIISYDGNATLYALDTNIKIGNSIFLNNINTKLEFEEIFPPTLKKQNIIKISSLKSPALNLPETYIKIRLLENTLYIDKAKTWFAGGLWSLNNLHISKDNNIYNADIILENNEISAILEHMKIKDLKVSGTLSGKIPLTWEKGIISINNGIITNNQNGKIIYLTDKDFTDTNLQNIKNALKDYNYNKLNLYLNGTIGKDFTATLESSGVNEKLYGDKPINLKLNIDGELEKYIKLILQPEIKDNHNYHR